eukprot:m51a1_g10083 hypothetical protein (567) ;mRNA; f:61811-67767
METAHTSRKRPKAPPLTPAQGEEKRSRRSKAQKAVLGRFYKGVPLPFVHNPRVLSLPLLGLGGDKAIQTSSGCVALSSLVRDGMVTSLVGMPGVGKTATAVSLARDCGVYVLYFCCSSAHSVDSVSDFGTDAGFVQMARDLEACFSNSEPRSPSTPLEFVMRDRAAKTSCESRVVIEVISRLLFLLRLLRDNPRLSSFDHLLAQVRAPQTGYVGQDRAVQLLKSTPPESLNDMLKTTRAMIAKIVPGVSIAAVFDEFQVCFSEILPKHFISNGSAHLDPQELFANEPRKGSLVLNPEYARSFGSIAVFVFASIRLCLFAMGTTTTIAMHNQVRSSPSNKEAPPHLRTYERITSFELCRDPRSCIASYVGIEDVSDSDLDLIPPEAIEAAVKDSTVANKLRAAVWLDTDIASAPAERLWKLLQGRYRCVLSVVCKLMQLGDDCRQSKAATLKLAICIALSRASRSLEQPLRAAIDQDKSRGLYGILAHLFVVAEQSEDGLEPVVISQTSYDLVNLSMCSLISCGSDFAYQLLGHPKSLHSATAVAALHAGDENQGREEIGKSSREED